MVAISYRHFGTTYLLKGCPEVSVINYRCSLCNNSEQRSAQHARISHLLWRGRMAS